jgi:hypothetical protein
LVGVGTKLEASFTEVIAKKLAQQIEMYLGKIEHRL